MIPIRLGLVAASMGMIGAQAFSAEKIPGAWENWDVSPIICEVCKDSTSWSDCTVRAERVFLGRNPSVERTGPSLRIRLNDGSPIVLQGDSSDGESFLDYRYLGTADPLKYHVVLMAGYEWHSYLMVNPKTGIQTRMDSFPVVSPDGKRVAAAAFETEGDRPNRLQIWTVGEDSLVVEASLVSHENYPDSTIEYWQVFRPRWIGSTKIKAEANAARPDEDARLTPFDTTAVFVRRDGKWMLE